MMKTCTLRPVSYDCYQVTEPGHHVELDDVMYEVPVGFWVVRLPNGQEISCPDEMFHAMYLLKGENAVGFYQTKDPYKVLIIHNDSTSITYVDIGGNTFTKSPEDFAAEYEPIPEPADAEIFYQRRDEALESLTKAVSAPEVAGDISAPEVDVTLPETGEDDDKPETQVAPPQEEEQEESVGPKEG